MPIPEVKIAHTVHRPGGRVRWEMDESGRHRIVVNESTSELSLDDVPGPWSAYVHTATWVSESGAEMYVALTEFYLDEVPMERLNRALRVDIG